jgi:hypothetical protein
MPVNRISATLGEAERQAVFAAIQTIRQKLPFLIDLTPEERRALPRFGEKSRGFVEQALQVAEQNPDIPPRSFGVGVRRIISQRPWRLATPERGETCLT